MEKSGLTSQAVFNFNAKSLLLVAEDVSFSMVPSSSSTRVGRAGLSRLKETHVRTTTTTTTTMAMTKGGVSQVVYTKNAYLLPEQTSHATLWQ